MTITVDFNILFPLGIIIATVIYLFISRAKFEEDIKNEYNQQYEQWKKQYENSKTKVIIKKPIGLAYEVQKDGKKEIEIEYFEQ